MVNNPKKLNFTYLSSSNGCCYWCNLLLLEEVHDAGLLRVTAAAGGRLHLLGGRGLRHLQ